MADGAAEDDAIYRVSGRKIMFSAITLDLLTIGYGLICVVLLFNMVRLNVYQPTMAQPLESVFSGPYWRIYGSVIFLTTLPFMTLLLVFYRRAPLLVLYGIFALLFFIFGAACQIGLIIDWTRCSQTLWCPCLRGWNIVGNALTMDYCTNGSNKSDEFLVHFWLHLVLLPYVLVLGGLSVWIHFTYYFRNEAYEVNNSRRSIAYSSIRSEMNDKPLPHLHEVRSKNI